MKISLLPARIFVLTLCALSLSSCMHILTMGDHGSHNGHEPMAHTKEVSNGKQTISVTIPALTTGTEDTITILLQSTTELSDSVSLHYMISKASPGSGSHNHGAGEESETATFETIHANVTFHKDTLRIAFTPTQAGRFSFFAEVEDIDPPLAVELNFMVAEKQSRGFLGIGGMWDYPVLGVIVMGTMMITVWAIRGSL